MTARGTASRHTATLEDIDETVPAMIWTETAVVEKNKKYHSFMSSHWHFPHIFQGIHEILRTKNNNTQPMSSRTWLLGQLEQGRAFCTSTFLPRQSGGCSGGQAAGDVLTFNCACNVSISCFVGYLGANWHRCGQSPFSIGNSPINGPFSTSM